MNPTSQQNPETVLTIIWLGFLMSVVVYNVVAILASPSFVPSDYSSADQLIVSLKTPLGYVAVASCALAVAASVALLRQPQRTGAAAMTPALFSYGIAQVPAVVGLVAAMTEYNFPALWLGSVVNVALLIALRVRSASATSL